MWVIGTIAIVAGGTGAWYFASGNEIQGHGQMVQAGICVGFLALGVYMTAYVACLRLTLMPYEIELKGLATTRSLRRDEILGFRTLTPRNGPSILVLVPREDGSRKLKIPGLFQYDQPFRDWLATLPDLDARDAEAVKREMESRPDLGATPEDRIRAVAQARRTCRLLNLVTIAVAAWGFLFPRPYPFVMALLAALPWVAVYVTSRYPGVVVINQRRNDPRPGAAVPFILPGLVLTLRVINDATPLGWQEPLALTLLVAGILTVAAWKADVTLQQRPASLLLILLLVSFYAYGSVMEADTLFDRIPPTVYQTAITDKYISRGKNTSFNLRLAPWGPKTKGDRVSVSRRYYDSKQIGDAICLYVRPGTIGIPWYDFGDCR